jgi:hypothetical protein
LVRGRDGPGPSMTLGPSLLRCTGATRRRPNRPEVGSVSVTMERPRPDLDSCRFVEPWERSSTPPTAKSTGPVGPADLVRGMDGLGPSMALGPSLLRCAGAKAASYKTACRRPVFPVVCKHRDPTSAPADLSNPGSVRPHRPLRQNKRGPAGMASSIGFSGYRPIPH